MKLGDLSRHISLLEQVLYENVSFEFKLYEFRLDESGPGFIEYEFRSAKFNLNQRYHRSSRAEESFLLETNYFENYMLRARVALDFTSVQFAGYKLADGKRVTEKLQEDLEMYLTKDWRDYRAHLKHRLSAMPAAALSPNAS